MANTQKISYLTPDQEDQLTNYRKKWQNLAFPISFLPEATIQATVETAYKRLNLAIPKIYIFESLFDIPDSFWLGPHGQNLGNVISLQDTLLQPLISTVASQVGSQLWGRLWNIAPKLDYTPLYPKGWGRDSRRKIKIDAFFRNPYRLRHCGRIDFCQGVLGCTLDIDAWETLYGLIQQGGWLFPHEYCCVAFQKRLINSIGTPFGDRNLALVNSLTQPKSQIFVSLQLAALESVAGRSWSAFQCWADTVSIAQERLSGVAQDQVLLAIIQQAKPITTYTDMDEYPFTYGASSPFAADVWEKCRQIVQLIETPALKIQAQSILPATSR